MEHRPLEITILSANDLKKVNIFKTMNSYVVATLAGDPRTTQRTEVAKGGGRNPTWNCPMSFAVDVTGGGSSRRKHHNDHHCMLTFKLKSKRTFGDKDIGEVHVPVKELLENGGDDPKSVKFVSYQVRRPAAAPKGMLNFSFRFGDTVASADAGGVLAQHTSKPVMAHPAPSNVGYAPVDAGRVGRPGEYPERMGIHGYGYGYRPVGGPGYGYPMYSGHGHRGEGRSEGLGMGVGAGLLGGLLVGDLWLIALGLKVVMVLIFEFYFLTPPLSFGTFTFNLINLFL